MSKKKNLKQQLTETHQEVEAIKTETKATVSGAKKHDNLGGMLFGKENYLLMGAGLVLILIGFALMAGGKSSDPNVFAKEELYSFRRITLAPILVLLGFAVEGYAIFKNPGKA